MLTRLVSTTCLFIIIIMHFGVSSALSANRNNDTTEPQRIQIKKNVMTSHALFFKDFCKNNKERFKRNKRFLYKHNRFCSLVIKNNEESALHNHIPFLIAATGNDTSSVIKLSRNKRIELVESMRSLSIANSRFSCKKPFTSRLIAIYEQTDDKKCEYVVSDKLTAFLSKMDNERAFSELKIDYLLAGVGDGIASSQGHSMIRIILCNRELLSDIELCESDAGTQIVFSYRADIDSFKISRWGALNGQYSNMLSVNSFAKILEEYNTKQLRDIYSIPLKLTTEEKINLVYFLVEQHFDLKTKYKILTNNCAHETHKAISTITNYNKLGNLTMFPWKIAEHISGLEWQGDSFEKSETDNDLKLYHSDFIPLSRAIKRLFDVSLQNRIQALTFVNNITINELEFVSKNIDKRDKFAFNFFLRFRRLSEERVAQYELSQYLASIEINNQSEFFKAYRIDYRRSEFNNYMDDVTLKKVRQLISDILPHREANLTRLSKLEFN